MTQQQPPQPTPPNVPHPASHHLEPAPGDGANKLTAIRGDAALALQWGEFLEARCKTGATEQELAAEFGLEAGFVSELRALVHVDGRTKERLRAQDPGVAGWTHEDLLQHLCSSLEGRDETCPNGFSAGETDGTPTKGASVLPPAESLSDTPPDQTQAPKVGKGNQGAAALPRSEPHVLWENAEAVIDLAMLRREADAEVFDPATASEEEAREYYEEGLAEVVSGLRASVRRAYQLGGFLTVKKAACEYGEFTALLSRLNYPRSSAYEWLAVRNWLDERSEELSGASDNLPLVSLRELLAHIRQRRTKPTGRSSRKTPDFTPKARAGILIRLSTKLKRFDEPAEAAAAVVEDLVAEMGLPFVRTDVGAATPAAVDTIVGETVPPPTPEIAAGETRPTPSEEDATADPDGVDAETGAGRPSGPREATADEATDHVPETPDLVEGALATPAGHRADESTGPGRISGKPEGFGDGGTKGSAELVGNEKQGGAAPDTPSGHLTRGGETLGLEPRRKGRQVLPGTASKAFREALLYGRQLAAGVDEKDVARTHSVALSTVRTRVWLLYVPDDLAGQLMADEESVQHMAIKTVADAVPGDLKPAPRMKPSWLVDLDELRERLTQLEGLDGRSSRGEQADGDAMEESSK